MTIAKSKFERAEMVPNYCSKPSCTLWAKWTVYLFQEDGTQLMVSFCKKHGKEKVDEVRLDNAIDLSQEKRPTE